MCRGTWFVSVMLSPGAITSSWEPDGFGQQAARRGKEIAVSCKMRTKQEIRTSMSYNVITMRLFIPTGQMPLLLKLERMFMVTLVGSQPVSSSLGTEDKKKPLLFFSLKWVLYSEVPLKLQKQSHWCSHSLKVSKITLTFTEIHQNYIFASEALWVGFPTHMALWRQRGHKPSSCPEPLRSCVQHSITPLLPHCWQ